jgi:hypothetical protein
MEKKVRSFSEMNVSELEGILNKLEKELEEIVEERAFVLRQTGMHIRGRTVQAYEAEINRLKARIAEIEEILQTKKPELS